MRRVVNQSGFSLLEMVVVVATILILAGALLGVGKYLKIRGSIDLTASELEVLSTALQQYYDDFGMFPFVTEKDITGDGTVDLYDEFHLEYDLNGTVVPDNAIDNPDMDEAAASSSALFYYLDRNPNSRMIVEALIDSLVTNKGVSGINLQMTLPSGQIDLLRFIDAWGTSIRYEYTDGTAFPTLTSAGPDAVFDTPDDVTSQ